MSCPRYSASEAHCMMARCMRYCTVSVRTAAAPCASARRSIRLSDSPARAALCQESDLCPHVRLGTGSQSREKEQARRCGVGAAIYGLRAACGAWRLPADREGPDGGARRQSRGRRSGGGLLLGRDRGGGQLLVVPCQDALSGLQQRDPAAGFQGLGALVDDHHVEAGVRQQLQRAVVGGAWWKSGPRAFTEGTGCVTATPEELTAS